MQEIKQRIGYIIIIVAALVVIAVTWIRFDEPSFDAPQGDVVSEDNIDTTPETELPNFAYVEERDGERVLVNERDGYEVVLEENWSVYESDFSRGIAVQDFIEPEPGYGGLPGCKVVIDKDNIDIEQYIQNEKDYCKENMCITDVTTDTKWINITSVGEFVGSGDPTFLSKLDDNTFILNFLCQSNDFINKIKSNLSI